MKIQNLKKNIFLNLLYQVFLVVIPFITAPYVSRVLGADGTGIYSYTNSIYGFVALFAVLGTTSYGSREIARCRDDKYLLSRTFWEIEILSIITSIICLIFWIFFCLLSEKYTKYYLIYSISFFALLFDISWFYVGLEEFSYSIKRNIIFKILGIIAIFIFVRTKDDLILYILINIMTLLLGNLSMWMFLGKFLTKISYRDLHVFHHLKETFVYFIPTISTSVYTLLDKALIGVITNDEYENGFYEQATKIIAIAKSVGVYSITGVLGSRMSYMYKSENKDKINELMNTAINVLMLLSIGLTFGIFSVADIFVPIFFGEGYEGTIILLRCLSPIVIIVGVSNCVGSLYYTPAGYRGKSSIFIIIGSVCNLILNLLLIPKFKSYGAAVGSVIAELIIAILYIVFCDKHFSIKVLIRCSVKRIIAALLMIALICFIKHRVSFSVFSLILLIFSGIITYFVALLILRDNIVYKTFDKILFRLKIKPILSIVKSLVKKLLFHVFWIFPVKKDQFFFDSFYGRSISCNPKYIYNYLLENNIIKSENAYWVVLNDKICTETNINVKNLVRYGSIKYFYRLLTSKILIVNTDIPAYLPLRKKQVLINTWHGGGAYKKFALDNPKENTLVTRFQVKTKEKQTRYFISSCGAFSSALQTALRMPNNKILECGFPRNDLLITGGINSNKIRSKLNIDSDTLIVLYAPTYRSSSDNQNELDYLFDFEQIKHEFELKFGKKVTFLFRAHYYFIENSKRTDIIDVTNYPDMQELLAAADILVTDYSSTFWDFCLTKKPAFLFCADLKEYDSERGFYIPIKEWPLPLAVTNEEFTNCIRNFDQKDYENKLMIHYKSLESFETGNSRQAVSDIIEKELKIK